MDVKQDKQAVNRNSWRTCKPAVVCDRPPSRDLMTPAPGWAAGRGANGSGAFAIDETDEILFALTLAVEQRDHHTPAIVSGWHSSEWLWEPPWGWRAHDW
jgi:hypothetical protein